MTDADGRTGTTNIDIVAGNTAPTVELILPLDGGFFEFGDTVKYEVTVTDPEDGTIDCSRVVVQPGLGHDQHSHGYEQYTRLQRQLRAARRRRPRRAPTSSAPSPPPTPTPAPAPPVR